jgi:hypothetical protein
MTLTERDVPNPQNGPYNLEVHGIILGVILIVLGLFLCFFGYRFFHITMFIIGFYFFANVTYIAMANAGVTSNTLLLVISIVVGIIGGLIVVCCSRLGAALLGALAGYVLALWILAWGHNGTLTTHEGQAILIIVLAVVGFILGFIFLRHTVIFGSALVGSYSTMIGIDMFAHTGFAQSAELFVNSNSQFEYNLTWEIYLMLAAFIVLFLLGVAFQWGFHRSRAFVPVTPTAPIQEKPSRWGRYRRMFRY